jgi:hypothetical protein
MKKEDIIIVIGEPEKAMIQTIKQTISLSKEYIKKHSPVEPTCNLSMYVRDVNFLLSIVERKP